MNEFRTTPSTANGVCKHRLLIGEVNPALRDYLLAVLRADGHEVVAMASGIDLLDTLAVSLHPEFGSGHFDLVIAEARMLGADEARLFSEFAHQAKVPPFVFTTVFRDKELQAKANHFGALAVLDKPITIDDLREIVNRALVFSTLRRKVPIWAGDVNSAGDGSNWADRQAPRLMDGCNSV